MGRMKPSCALADIALFNAEYNPGGRRQPEDVEIG
jgi:hypothetical protein